MFASDPIFLDFASEIFNIVNKQRTQASARRAISVAESKHVKFK
jgi:hypothetical protein